MTLVAIVYHSHSGHAEVLAENIEGSVSSTFKAFMDATSKLWFQQSWKKSSCWFY